MDSRLRPGTVRVRTPATSANLGPGFDAFGLALALYDELELATTDSGLVVDVTGEDASSLPRDEKHLVVRAIRTLFDHCGVAQPGLRLRCRNVIPHGRGLGSSAAAVVGGLVAARALLADGVSRPDDQALLSLATGFEGHPDNAAACLSGGLSIAWSELADVRAVRLEPHPDVRVAVYVPTVRASTEAVRGLLPSAVPHADAAANAGRAALLAHALTRCPELLLPATEEWLHQRYRAEAMPASAALVAKLRDDEVPAVISGAGPTVLAFSLPDKDFPAPADGFERWLVNVDTTGVLMV